MDCPSCRVDIVDVEKAKQGLLSLGQCFSSIRWVFQSLERLIRENLHKRSRWSYGEIIANLPLTETASIQVKAGKKRFFLEQDILFELTVSGRQYWIQNEIPDEYICLIYNSLSSLINLLNSVVPEAGIKAYFQNLQQQAI